MIDLNELVRTHEHLLKRVIGEDIELVTTTEPVPPIRADARQIEQVIMNLAANARAAMPHGGKLTIATRNGELANPGGGSQQCVELSVTDSGVGMDADTLTRAFEPFFSTKEAGVGLGLSTCYAIVTQSGGTIVAESEPGRGTTFRVRLPAFDGADSERASVARVAGSPGGEGTLLVVDDNAELRSVAARILEEAGYRVLQAGNSNETLEIAGSFDGAIDLLLTDVIMPGISGPDLAPRVRVTRPEIAVLFMTGYASELIETHGILKPHGSVIQKPFDQHVLLEHVQQALSGRRVAAR